MSRMTWWSYVNKAVKQAKEVVPSIRSATAQDYSPENDEIDAPEPLPMPRLDGLGEDELRAMLDSYRAEVQRIGMTPEQRREDASIIRPLKCDGAAEITDKLDRVADIIAARRDSLLRAAEAVEKRIPQVIAEREAAAAERADVDANLVGIVKELRAEIAGLKADLKADAKAGA